jgi:hypothetical protein
MNDTGLMLTQNSMPVMEIELMLERRKLMVKFVGAALLDGTDYGVIPGTGKDKTLLKPGAEKLCTFFGLRPTFEAVKATEDWTGQDHGGEPFFYYWMRCRLIRNGEIMAEGDGSCSSRESKYRYRQGERKCPTCDKAAIKRSKFPPRDKPDATPGWYCHDKAGGCGANFAYTDKRITDQETGRVTNPDIADQQNTILKMAQKRAMIAATLIGVNASEFFTQDLEDTVEPGTIEGTARHVDPTPKQRPDPPKATVQRPVATPTNGTRPPAASTPPVAAPVARVMTSEEADIAEFDAMGKAPLSAAAGLPAALWIDDEAARKNFFAWVGSQGMRDEEVYVALNCKTMHEFTGTKQDAKAAILAYLKRKFAAQAQRETTQQPAA